MKKQARKKSDRVSPRFEQSRIAIVYDFDGTLTPLPMQEYTVFPKLGIKAEEFWGEVERERKKERGDEMLTYLRLLVEVVERQKKHLSREDIAALGHRIRYFPGVEEWFPRINAYIKAESKGRIQVEHYIISAGLKEILEGVSIRKYFREIYASEYHFNHHGVATFPKTVINDTIKTQFLFRINKGREVGESINDYMPEKDRRIPFQNILYIGDGMTDVPSMTVTKKSGGAAIAVLDKKRGSAEATCRKLFEAGRIDYFAPADYRPGKLLDRRVKLLLDLMMSRIEVERERFGVSEPR